MTAARVSFVLDTDVRERAIAVASDLGEILLAESQNQELPDPAHERRSSRTLSGNPGYALASLALHRASGDERYERSVHEHLRLAAHCDDRPHTGLFSGISGLRAVAQVATAMEPRYASLVEKCDAFVESELPAEPEQAQSFSVYDLISGWAGVRLARCVDGPREPDRALDFVAWMLDDRERWCCSHPVYDNGPENDLGLAHGLAGMLAAFGLTLREIPEAYRQRVHDAARLLAESSITYDGVPSWSPSFQRRELAKYRHAWCYGSPGICAALVSVGSLLGDTELVRFASDALARVAAKTPEDWTLTEAGICHGMIGNALCFASVGVATGNEALFEPTQRAVRLAFERLERDGERCMTAADGSFQDSIGELTGAAGVVVGLLTLAGVSDAAWMRCHGLQPIH